MVHRIRVSLLLTRGDQILFVKEIAAARFSDIDIDPSRSGFWQLPGGGLEPGESVYEAALREAREETSLVVRPERVVYVQEYVNPIEPFYQVEFIVAASILGGQPSVPQNDPVFGIQFLSEKERDKYNIAPWHDRAVIWADLERGFPEFRHLGVDSVQSCGSPRSHTDPFPAAANANDGGES